ncbi:MAG TPA: hemerythrin domain-containing protein [Holophagaceae bacterium]|nr:hemerythrin domain-containing protein [Holophagaceae bacterium]
MDPVRATDVHHPLFLHWVEEHDEGLQRLQALRNSFQKGDVALARSLAQHFGSELNAHHAYEEAHLFPRLEGHFQNGGPLPQMRAEHKRLAELVALAQEAMLAPLRAEEARAWLEALEILLKSHLDAETRLLYPLAEQALTPTDQEQLSRYFEPVEGFNS